MNFPFFNKPQPNEFNKEKVFLKIHKDWQIWIKRDKDGKFIEMYGRNFK